MILHLTAENFEKEVLKSSTPILVDFWAPWCGPCRMVAPVLEELDKEADGYKIGKVNVDEEPSIASLYGVMSIPTLIVFKEGKPVSKAVGLRSKEDLKKMLL